MNAVLGARRGDTANRARLLEAALDTLREAQYFIFRAMFLCDFAEVLSAAGRGAEAVSAADDAVRYVEQTEALWYLPEALRLKGELLCLRDASGMVPAEDHFRQALDCAHRQGALPGNCGPRRAWPVCGGTKAGFLRLRICWRRCTSAFLKVLRLPTFNRPVACSPNWTMFREDERVSVARGYGSPRSPTKPWP